MHNWCKYKVAQMQIILQTYWLAARDFNQKDSVFVVLIVQNIGEGLQLFDQLFKAILINGCNDLRQFPVRPDLNIIGFHWLIIINSAKNAICDGFRSWPAKHGCIFVKAARDKWPRVYPGRSPDLVDSVSGQSIGVILRF